MSELLRVPTRESNPSGSQLRLETLPPGIGPDQAGRVLQELEGLEGRIERTSAVLEALAAPEGARNRGRQRVGDVAAADDDALGRVDLEGLRKAWMLRARLRGTEELMSGQWQEHSDAFARYWKRLRGTDLDGALRTASLSTSRDTGEAQFLTDAREVWHALAFGMGIQSARVETLVLQALAVDNNAALEVRLEAELARAELSGLPAVLLEEHKVVARQWQMDNAQRFVAARGWLQRTDDRIDTKEVAGKKADDLADQFIRQYRLHVEGLRRGMLPGEDLCPSRAGAFSLRAALDALADAERSSQFRDLVPTIWTGPDGGGDDADLGIADQAIAAERFSSPDPRRRARLELTRLLDEETFIQSFRLWRRPPTRGEADLLVVSRHAVRRLVWSGDLWDAPAAKAEDLRTFVLKAFKAALREVLPHVYSVEGGPREDREGEDGSSEDADRERGPRNARDKALERDANASAFILLQLVENVSYSLGPLAELGALELHARLAFLYLARIAIRARETGNAQRMWFTAHATRQLRTLLAAADTAPEVIDEPATLRWCRAVSSVAEEYSELWPWPETNLPVRGRSPRTESAPSTVQILSGLAETTGELVSVLAERWLPVAVEAAKAGLEDWPLDWSAVPSEIEQKRLANRLALVATVKGSLDRLANRSDPIDSPSGSVLSPPPAGLQGLARSPAWFTGTVASILQEGLPTRTELQSEALSLMQVVGDNSPPPTALRAVHDAIQDLRAVTVEKDASGREEYRAERELEKDDA